MRRLAQIQPLEREERNSMRNIARRVRFEIIAVVLILTGLLLVPLTTIQAGETNRVEIDAQQTGAVISPLLFGHNLEVTRRGIWQGLGAEMVANRKFAAVDKELPKGWEPILDGGRVVVDGKLGYAGKQCVRVEVNDQGKPCGLAQSHAFLAFRKDEKYAVRIWMKTDAARKVKMRLVDASGTQPQFEKEWSVKKGDWQLLSGTFPATVTGENNRLEIGSRDAGGFWIGAVSVQPANAFHGMRRDVIELFKRIKPSALRYPGGCYAEYFTWKESLLPVDQRPPIGPTPLDFLLRDSYDVDSQEVGIDDFMALCHEVGAEPTITVRMCERTPEDAAALVEYCNGGPQTQWGEIRAERGYPQPYGVKCWFVGNELWGVSRGGLNNANVCAEQTKLFAAAMKKVDPTIHLAGCTYSGDWNKTMIAQGSKQIEYFSVHDYLFDRAGNFQSDLSQIARDPTQGLRKLLMGARDGIQRDMPAGRDFSMTFDEWNTNWGLQGSVGMGFYAAGVLHLLSREAVALKIERSFFFMPVNEGAIHVRPLEARLDPAGEVFELFAVHQGNRLLKMPEMAADADLDLCASVCPGRGNVCVSAINRNIHEERTIELNVRNFTGSFEVAATLLVPEQLDANARAFRKFNQKLKPIDGKRVIMELPPGAIARMCLGKP
jgi:alpha-L-arabinofuranosidase